MGDPVRIAVLGNGFSERAQLPALRWCGGNEVVAIAGRDAGRARATAQRWGIGLGTGDWREALSTAPDLVLVTTPVHLHREMVLAALDSGAAVLCEKPFALDAAEAAELVDAAEGRAAFIDHELRWSPCRRALRALLREGFLGEPWHGHFALEFGSQRWLEKPWSWWFDASRGGGTLGALGSHMIDLVRWELGEVEAVRAELRTFVPERPDADGVARRVTADEHAWAWLRLACGATVSLHCTMVSPGGRGFRLQYTGSAATVRLDDESQLSAAPHGEDLAPVAVEDDRPTEADLGIDDRTPFARALPLFLRAVLAAVREGRTEVEGAATFADGLAVQRVLDAARASAAGEGGWVNCG